VTRQNKYKEICQEREKNHTIRMMETQYSSPIYVIPQNMLQKQQQQSLMKLSSNPTLAPAPAKYRVILSDVNKINKVLVNDKVQIAKSKPIATVVGCKRPAAALSPVSIIKTDIKMEEDNDEEAEGDAPMRKRANLDHLSPDERLQRRKLKNRVAAQNARDKKKAQTDDMEKMIEQMRIEKQLLAAENARLLALTEQLQQENLSLSEENADFKQRLGYPAPISIELPLSPASLPPLSPSPSDVTMSPPSSVTSVTVAPPESSELTYAPLLQEQGAMQTSLTSQSLRSGLSSNQDLTRWAQGCVVTLSCVLITLMSQILRQSSQTPSPSLSPSLTSPQSSQSLTKLPLKKRNWEVWSPPPPERS